MTLRSLSTGIWAYAGLLIFVFAFLRAPSRDGLQIIYLFAFLVPIFILQTVVLGAWLSGSSLVFSYRDVDVQKYLNWLIGSGVVIILVSVGYHYQVVFGKVSQEIRFYGWNVFRNANEIGALSGIITSLALVAAFQSKTLARACLFYVFASCSLVGLVASYSRGALVAFFVMMVVALLLVRPPIKIWFGPLILFLAGVVLLVFYIHVDIDFQGRGAALGERAIIWKEVLIRSKEHLLLGIGMSKDTNIVVANVDVFNHAHNAWLDTFYRTGVIGLLLSLLHLGIVMRTFESKPYLIPLYIWLGYGAICNLFDSRCFFWEIGAKWFLYWIPIGSIAANLTRDSARSAHSIRTII